MYFKDIETDKKKLAAHIAALKLAARRRLDAVAEKKREAKDGR